jgi:hypothetical protein
MESPDRLIVGSRDDTRFATARHACRGSRRPDVYIEQAAKNVDLSAVSAQAATLSDAQRSHVVAMDH